MIVKKSFISVYFLSLILSACSSVPQNIFEHPDNEVIAKINSHTKLYVPTGRRVFLADFYSPPEYQGEWRCDTHPRSTLDGNYVIWDFPNWDGRQMYMLDIRDIIKLEQIEN